MSQKILGVKIDNVTIEDALNKALKFASEGRKHYICTPNPEMLLEALKNRKFKRILNDSSLNIPDGYGILLAAKWKGKKLNERVTGTDLMREILKKTDLGVFLLGGQDGVGKKIKGKNIVGTYEGTPNEDSTKTINESGAKILFVAYGTPAQELWIAANLKKLKTVRLAIGVGGAFDFLAGQIKRAPLWIRKLGLEWLYRLMKEPKRIKRIINATIKFPIKIIFSS